MVSFTMQCLVRNCKLKFVGKAKKSKQFKKRRGSRIRNTRKLYDSTQLNANPIIDDQQDNLETTNKNIATIVVETDKESSREKEKAEHHNNSNNNNNEGGGEGEREVLPEFVVYDEAVGAMDELAGIKRMCLPLRKMAPDNIIIPDDWRAAAEFIINGDSSSGRVPPIVVVCGAQNVGKTTFARFLFNTMLTRYKKVGYLDTDVGQPEFTPPGCLSLHILDKPNPDLSILCLRTPERCYFYGDISPKSDPEAYLHIIVNLYDHFRKGYYDMEASDESEPLKRVKLPLVVNTLGWVKGIGYDVLVDMLRYMVPTHVVQIRLSAVSKNLPFGIFWASGSDYESSTKPVYLGTAMKDVMNKSIVIQKHGRQMRELRIVAYFQQCFSGSSENVKTYKELARALASHPPYQVSMQKIKVMHLHCQVPDSEMYYSLNGTIVGLAITSKNCLETFSIPVCVGLGIVRGIDILKCLFYLITPVPIGTLQNVDMFLQGFIEIPVSLLQTQGLICPYMSLNAISREGTGAGSIKGVKQRDKKTEKMTHL